MTSASCLAREHPHWVSTGLDQNSTNTTSYMVDGSGRLGKEQHPTHALAATTRSTPPLTSKERKTRGERRAAPLSLPVRGRRHAACSSRYPNCTAGTAPAKHEQSPPPATPGSCAPQTSTSHLPPAKRRANGTPAQKGAPVSRRGLAVTPVAPAQLPARLPACPPANPAPDPSPANPSMIHRKHGPQHPLTGT
jgi:hypothetical protein